MNVDLCYWVENTGGTIYNTTTWNQMWSSINSAYGTNSHVYYEPINEPYSYSASQLADIYENFLTTYKCPNWKCFFDGTGYAQYLGGVATDTKLDNQYFAIHIYQEWDGVTAPNNGNPAFYGPALKSAIDGYENQTIITEMGVNCTDGTDYYMKSGTNLWGDVAYLNGVCNYMNSAGMGSTGWSGLNDPDSYHWWSSSSDIASRIYTIVNPTVMKEFQYGWNLYTSTSVPGIPGFPTATPSNGQVALSWKASQGGATSYNVYRGTSSYGEGSTPIATGLTGTSYTDTAVVTNTTYYYTIAAVNANGTSPASIEANATVITNGTYRLTPQCATGSSLEVSAWGTTNGSTVDIWSWVNQGNEKWTFTNMGGGWYKIQPSYSTTLSLEVSGYGSTNGSKVDVWADVGQTNERWSVTAVTGGYELTPENAPGQSLNVTGGGSANGTKAQIWQWYGEQSSIWAIQ
jgi:hypothetical protein